MIEELKQLKKMREDYEQLRVEDENLVLSYTQTPEYKLFEKHHQVLVVLRDQIELLEREIRELAVERSRETGFVERKFGVVMVKEFTKVVINNMQLAIEWASRNAPACLALTKEFDKVVKVIPLSFATVEKEYKAQIASDLSKLDYENE